MLDVQRKTVSNGGADTDLPPAQCLQRSIEAPPKPCEMLGDEAELPGDDPGSKTLCPRCELLARFHDLKTVTDFSRWLRDMGASRSVATKLAGHGWPKGESDEAVRSLQPAEMIRAMIAKLER